MQKRLNNIFTNIRNGVARLKRKLLERIFVILSVWKLKYRIIPLIYETDEDFLPEPVNIHVWSLHVPMSGSIILLRTMWTATKIFQSRFLLSFSKWFHQNYKEIFHWNHELKRKCMVNSKIYTANLALRTVGAHLPLSRDLLLVGLP